MSMRILKIVTHLRPVDAHMLIEFLDQAREVLMLTYGQEIIAMLQEATTTIAPRSADGDDEPF